MEMFLWITRQRKNVFCVCVCSSLGSPHGDKKEGGRRLGKRGKGREERGKGERENVCV